MFLLPIALAGSVALAIVYFENCSRYNSLQNNFTLSQGRDIYIKKHTGIAARALCDQTGKDILYWARKKHPKAHWLLDTGNTDTGTADSRLRILYEGIIYLFAHSDKRFL